MRRTAYVPVFVLVFVLVFVSLLAGAAFAQVPQEEARPTRGVHVAGATRAGDADVASIALNPAQLGLLPAGGLSLAGDLSPRGAPLAGRGFGAYAGGPALHGGLGIAYEYVLASPNLGVEAHRTFRLAYALRLGQATSLGVSWTHVWGSRWRGADSADFGLSRRFGRHAALGLVVADVGEPAISGVAGVSTLRLLWAGELVVRPLGTDRLELALGATHVDGERWRWLVPSARLAGRLTDGLRIFAAGQSLPRGSQLALASGADYEAELGLALDFDHLGLTASGRGGFPGAGGPNSGGGGAFVARFEGQRRAPLVAAAVVARVKLEGSSGDREYVGLVRRLRALARDRSVAAVLLHVESDGLGLGRIEELRALVAQLRARGKRVYAYGSFPSTRDYYLATACDGIVIHPAGALSLTGFSQTVTFYKGAMDKLGVNVDLVRIAEYKGAMEPFVMSEQSGPVRANRNDLLDDVFKRFLGEVARVRGGPGHVLDEAGVRALVDRGIFTPDEARAAGLVDAIADDDEIEDVLRRALGRPSIALRDPDPSPLEEAWPARKVAVLLVDGAIVDGASHEFPLGLSDVVGSDTLVAALEQCRQDAGVAGVVLRVNSPGGSAFASDVVARAIVKLRKAGKPVIVSMGDLAASGGYYISAPADAIFAEPSTLTGSIGIFGYKVDVGKLLGTLGLTTETFKRGEHADYLSPYRPWTKDELAIAQAKIAHFYDLFLATIVDGRRSRGLTRARVDEIGRGHVWTGAEALDLGLVDRLGGLSDAIDFVAALARVPVNRDGFPALTVLPPEPTALFNRLGKLAGATDDRLLEHAIARAVAKTPAARLLAPLLLGSGTGVEARLPYDLEIR
jgi:protease IV